MDTKLLHAALAFLDIHKPKWKVMIEDSVLAEAEASALAYMQKILHSGAGRLSAMDIGDLPEVHANDCGKRRRPTIASLEETRLRRDNLADSIRRRSGGGARNGPTLSMVLSHLNNKKARESKREG
jgi:hypothetical protein